MDIARLKHQHTDILARIDALRKLAHDGVEKNARLIAQQVKQLGAVVTLHLAIEDRIVYPAARKSDDERVALLGERYQEEMTGIANAYIRFTSRWSDEKHVSAEPNEFRRAANTVLKEVYQRMRREDAEFYPVIERL